VPLPTPYSLTLYRGDSYTWIFRFWLDAEHTEPADLTGSSALATFSIGTASLDVACPITDNEVSLTLAGSSWDTLPHGSGRWDLHLTDATGWETTPLAGWLSIQIDATEYANR